MIDTKTINTSSPIEKFYEDYFCFSYSSLNKLLHSAQAFYNWYILKEKEDSLATYLIDGKVIHCLILDKKMFDDQFSVMPSDVPGVSNKKVIEFIYRLWQETNDPLKDLHDYEDQVLQWLKNNDLHQKLKDDKDLKKVDALTGDTKRLNKVFTSKSINYFSYLKQSENKDVIDQTTLDRCEEAVNALKTNRKVRELLRMGEETFELTEVHNEKPLAAQLQEYPFGIKGIVDNYIIDHATKKVYINDLKTTGKTLKEFKDSVDYYKYWMQAAIYMRMVKANHTDTADYEYVFHFIVIDKYNQVYSFPVSVESMLDWHSQLDEVLKIANYHYTKKDYTLPYEFALGQVTL